MNFSRLPSRCGTKRPSDSRIGHQLPCFCLAHTSSAQGARIPVRGIVALALLYSLEDRFHVERFPLLIMRVITAAALYEFKQPVWPTNEREQS